MTGEYIYVFAFLAGVYLFIGWIVELSIRDSRYRIDKYNKLSLFILIFWPLELAWLFIYHLVDSFVREIDYWLWKSGKS